MATKHEDAGIIEKTVVTKMYEETYIEWRISDFLSIAKTKDPWTTYKSPAFVVYDDSWFLKLHPKSPFKKGFSWLYLSTAGVKREYSIEYDFSLKNSDGSVQHLVSGILKGDETSIDSKDHIKISELQRMSELAPDNVLTIICRLKREATHSIQSNVSDEMKLMNK